MDLHEVRTLFVKQTGRYDLVTVSGATYANNPSGFGGGADHYIREGSRYLDQQFDFSQAEGELEVTLATSAWTTTLDNVRAVRGVAVLDSQDETMVYLEKKSLKGLREAYGDENGSLSSVETGEPTAWTLGYLDASTTTAQRQLILMPPADRTYTLKVTTLRFSDYLSDNADVNFWTLMYPQLLIWAAMYHLEVSYRNMEGAKTVKAILEDRLADIDNDVVEQQIVQESHPKSIFRFIEDTQSRYDRHIEE